QFERNSDIIADYPMGGFLCLGSISARAYRPQAALPAASIKARSPVKSFFPRFAPPFTHRYLTFSFRYPAHGSSVGTDESSIVTFRYRAILCDGCAYACGFAAGTLMPLY